MVLDTELAWAGVCQWPLVPILLRGLLSASTLGLLGLILAFHIKDIQLYMLENGLRDWRVALGPARLGLILLELGVCALHPPPPPLGPPPPVRPGAGPGAGHAAAAVLGAPRRPHGHSAGGRGGAGGPGGGWAACGCAAPSPCAPLLARHPAALLLALALGAWVLSAWVLAACESGVPGGAGGLGATLWLVPITFLTIGYGDLVPGTICGRLVCLVAGILGVGCTALLVAVAAEKLEFTRAEKHVHNFMLGVECARKMKHTAATVLQEAWRVHRHRRRQEPARARRHQRRLLSTLHTFRELRLQHRALREQVNSMVDISKMQLVLGEISAGLSSGHQELRQRLDGLEWKLDALARRLGTPGAPPTPPGR
ncbi:LOW QUALITY PROTEIN: intermediate conductance calcium-activated potassium channel protein 4 [Alligator mississippiensis]|uniref:LOW QUALITY PROTEIN: intermediate conductance calcium-activated potassium channel protein 4 n=1 Tax=Alligator mississippiensis TaxID=8496 RepID=UPI002877D6D6|nr:LOW QUALITY PROTEIN: intermediate conductance calcium-activated potassium channel protein 4 [Alligator mississippiensis]